MSAPKPAKVFISTTSGDLRSVRNLIKDALLKIGCMPIEQADFPPDYRKVAEFLAAEIGNCDAVIHVVGKRYGAEPDPATLPPGTVRRSYTQLEYDAACKLKKQIYTFICADDFPYDVCEPEPELKTLLQAAHRESLIRNGLKYERVATPADCKDKAHQLRLQLEELARQIRAEHKRQMVAWSVVAGTLSVLLVLAIAIWSLLRETRTDVANTSQSTADLVDSTANLLRKSVEVGRDVSASLQTQKTSLEKVNSIDSKVLLLLESDLLTSISQKVGVEPQQIKQLVLQSNAANVTTLEYAAQLAKQDRHDAGYALARFVGETALLLENSNYQAAAEAFLIAARAVKQLALENKNDAEQLKQFTDMDVLTMRGLDALRTLSLPEQNAAQTLYTDLALERAYSLSNKALMVVPSDAKSTISKALVQLDDAQSRSITDACSLATLHRRRAFCLAEKANWVGFKEAQILLEQAVNECEKSLNQLSDTNDYELKSKAILVKVLVRLNLAELLPRMPKRDLLNLVEQDCTTGLEIASKNAPSQTSEELATYHGLARLMLAQNTEAASEQKQHLTAAIQRLTEAFKQAERHQFVYAASKAATGLLSAQLLSRNEGEATRCFNLVKSYGFNTNEKKFVLCEYAMLRAQNESDGCIPDIDAAIDLARKVQESHSYTVAPRTFANAAMILARSQFARAEIRRYDQEANTQFGRASVDRQAAYDTLSFLLQKITRDDAPSIWAEARYLQGWMLGTALRWWWDPFPLVPNQDEQTIEAFSDALTVYTPESDPVRYGLANQGLADAYRKRLRQASNPGVKEQARSQALRCAVTATRLRSQWDDSSTETQERINQWLSKFVEDIKSKLPESEQKEIDAEVSRLQQEILTGDGK
jgi:hypothetical protein